MPDQDISAELRDACRWVDSRPAEALMRAAADEIDRLRSDGWVRCSERLPRERDLVLAWVPRRGVALLSWERNEYHPSACDGVLWLPLYGTPSHWRPLPPPPSIEGACRHSWKAQPFELQSIPPRTQWNCVECHKSMSLPVGEDPDHA